MVDKKETKVEEGLRYELAQVPETMRTVIKDNKTNEVYTEMEILLTILNKVEKIERSVA
jgi:hypothetical protein